MHATNEVLLAVAGCVVVTQLPFLPSPAGTASRSSSEFEAAWYAATSLARKWCVSVCLFVCLFVCVRVCVHSRATFTPKRVGPARSVLRGLACAIETCASGRPSLFLLKACATVSLTHRRRCTRYTRKRRYCITSCLSTATGASPSTLWTTSSSFTTRNQRCACNGRLASCWQTYQRSHLPCPTVGGEIRTCARATGETWLCGLRLSEISLQG